MCWPDPASSSSCTSHNVLCPVRGCALLSPRSGDTFRRVILSHRIFLHINPFHPTPNTLQWSQRWIFHLCAQIWPLSGKASVSPHSGQRGRASLLSHTEGVSKVLWGWTFSETSGSFQGSSRDHVYCCYLEEVDTCS